MGYSNNMLLHHTYTKHKEKLAVWTCTGQNSWHTARTYRSCAVPSGVSIYSSNSTIAPAKEHVLLNHCSTVFVYILIYMYICYAGPPPLPGGVYPGMVPGRVPLCKHVNEAQ